MAQIIRIAPNNPYGAQIVRAAAQLREAIGTLQELNGLPDVPSGTRDQAIAGGQTEMMSIFGTSDETAAQALGLPGQARDRWQSLLNVVFNPAAAQFDEFVYLRDFMNNVVFDV